MINMYDIDFVRDISSIASKTKPTGSFGTTQPLGAAVMRKGSTGTFGPPVEALRNDPAKYLKKGTKTRTGTGAPGDINDASAAAASSSTGGGGGVPAANKKGAFTYPGER